jgi:AcrR family transcriptional regulator
MCAVTSRPNQSGRRKPAEERRAEIVETAGRIALSDGLDQVTAKRVADRLGVYPGLVNHYFSSADDLVAAAFGHATATEREEVFGHAEAASSPLEQMRRLFEGWFDAERDAGALLWLDGCQASRRRPALLAEVARQLDADLARLAAIIHGGAGTGAFTVADPTTTAMRILALVDGLSVQASVRSVLDYTAASDMVIDTTERELDLPQGALRAGC